MPAVRATLRELEAQVPLCRPTVNGEQVHTPGELGIAVFTHHTSRPSPEVAAHPGRPPDPQLHSHAFLFNLAWCQGRFLAIDSKPLLRFASTAEAIYTCELAAQLQQLGYRLRWQQTRRGPTFDLEGVDPSVTGAAVTSPPRLSPVVHPGMRRPPPDPAGAATVAAATFSGRRRHSTGIGCSRSWSSGS